MDFDLSPEQEELRSTARAYLQRTYPPDRVRRMGENRRLYDESDWKALAELGWTALGIPEAYGGFGTLLDLVVVLEEAGRVNLPGPLLSTMGMAVPIILEAGGEAQKRDLLGAIAAGRARATAAISERTGRWDATGIAQVTAEPAGAGWRLSGTKHYVTDAAVADHIVVAARTRGEGEDGITLFVVSGRPEGLEIRTTPTLDLTRDWFEVSFNGVEVDDGARLGPVDRGWPPLQRALHWATAALCAEMVGGAAEILERSVQYAKTRHQFGKPIGVYQAIAHRLANMLLEVENARSTTYYAAWAVEADAEDRALAASVAKACVSDAFRDAANGGIQVHGGIGFTWEHEAHLYLKRAKGSEKTLGDATYHRELIAQHLDL